MMVRVWLVVLACACACGRISFDARNDSAAADAFVGCPVTTAAAGRNQTCAVDQRGAVWCFGVNAVGQSVPGGPVVIVEPTQVPLAGPVVQVAAGREVTCARLDDGRVQCWGSNENGKLGDGTTT